MELSISVREALGAVASLFDREVTNYPGLDREFVANRGRSMGRGENPLVYSSVQQVWRAQYQSRLLCTYNEFALCALENRVNYVTGEEGFGVVAAPRQRTNNRVMRLCGMVKDFLEVFEEVNAVEQMISESEMREDRDGEFFIRLFFGKDGMTHLRFVEPEHVFNMNDTLDPRYSFGIETSSQDTVTPLAVYIQERPWEGSTPVRIDQRYVVHSKRNVTMNEKRGVPTFLAVGPNLLRCEDLLGSMTQIARTRAKIALIRKMTNVTKQTAESLLNSLLKKTITNPDNTITNIEDLQPGSVVTTGDNVEHQFPEYKFGADDFVEVLQAELRAIASRFKMPEWMFTALADAKYNNAFVVESTATKEFKKLQRGLHKVWVTNRAGHRRSIYWRAILHAVEMKRLPAEVISDIKLTCSGPMIVTRNKKEESEVNKTYFSMGMRDATSIQQEQGFDPDEVKQNRIASFKEGSLKIPPRTLNFIYKTLEAMKVGEIEKKSGYTLLASAIGVPSIEVEQAFPVSPVTPESVTNVQQSTDSVAT